MGKKASTGTRPPKPSASPLVPRSKVWIECGGEYVFGQGICLILEAVEATGNIKDAAAQINKSYRYVWNRIKEAEQALGQSLVEARVGGADSHRSSLTPLAKQLIAQYRALRQRVIEMVDAEFPRWFPK
ncbi:MAG: LysR family transcriptional regulator [Pirellulales bacterium]